jgi:chromatin modification-related protein VID21
MSKTQYFRAYHARLEAAQRTLMAQQQAALQQQPNNPSQPSMRRRTAQPVRVDRRKNTKHLAMIDGMRKLAKKRETSIQKQQHGEPSPWVPRTTVVHIILRDALRK